MKPINIALLSIVGLIVLIALMFVFGWTGVFYTKTVGKAQENARRQVFEQTQSYVEGKRQELTKYRLEYLRSKDTADKQAIRATIVQSFANFDETKLPEDLRGFLDQMKSP